MPPCSRGQAVRCNVRRVARYAFFVPRAVKLNIRFLQKIHTSSRVMSVTMHTNEKTGETTMTVICDKVVEGRQPMPWDLTSRSFTFLDAAGFGADILGASRCVSAPLLDDTGAPCVLLYHANATGMTGSIFWMSLTNWDLIDYNMDSAIQGWARCDV